MKKEDFEQSQENGKVEIVSPALANAKPPEDTTLQKNAEFDLAYIIEGLKVTHKPNGTIPIFIPRNFSEQIQLYENGATVRLYIYVNKTWRYIALT